jgi:uncharacterized repeat protein (TIGR01451 family)
MGAVLSAVALVALSAGWVGGGSALAAPAGPVVPPVGVTVDKVDICHSTGAAGNPYVTNTSVNVSSIVPAPTGHTAGNDGIIGVYPAAAWGDIVPPFQWDNAGVITQFPGQNWTGAGQFYFTNNCEAVHVAAVTPTVSPSVCVAGVPTVPSFTIPNTPGVSYSVDGAPKSAGDLITGVSTTKVLTAVASAGFVLTNAPFSVNMVFGPQLKCTTDATAQNAGAVTASSCVANVAVPSLYIVPTTTGVQYKVTGVGNVASGSKRSGSAPASETLTAEALAGYVLTNPAFSQKIDFGALATNCAPVVVVPVPPVVVPSPSASPSPSPSPTPAPVDEDLGISKTGLEDSVVPGDVLSWSVNVTNVKGTPASGFTVTDVLADGLTFLTAGGADWSCTNAGQTVTCTYSGAPLPVGSSSAFQLDSLVGFDYAGSSVSNTAVVDPGGVDTTNDSATAVTPVVFTGGGGGTVVEPPAATPEPTEGGGEALPFTGSYTDKMLSAGVAMLLLGLFLALGGRRRRTS